MLRACCCRFVIQMRGQNKRLSVWQTVGAADTDGSLVDLVAAAKLRRCILGSRGAGLSVLLSEERRAVTAGVFQRLQETFSRAVFI